MRRSSRDVRELTASACCTVLPLTVGSVDSGRLVCSCSGLLAGLRQARAHSYPLGPKALSTAHHLIPLGRAGSVKVAGRSVSGRVAAAASLRAASCCLHAWNSTSSSLCAAIPALPCRTGPTETSAASCANNGSSHQLPIAGRASCVGPDHRGYGRPGLATGNQVCRQLKDWLTFEWPSYCLLALFAGRPGSNLHGGGGRL